MTTLVVSCGMRSGIQLARGPYSVKHERSSHRFIIFAVEIFFNEYVNNKCNALAVFVDISVAAKTA